MDEVLATTNILKEDIQMNFKKVNLIFDDVFAGLDVELHGDDNYVLTLTEYEEREGESTHSTIEPKTVTEVYLGREEIKSIANALIFLMNEDDLS